MKRPDLLFDLLIAHRHTLTLAQVFKPGLQHELFDEPGGVSGVAPQLPMKCPSYGDHDFCYCASELQRLNSPL